MTHNFKSGKPKLFIVHGRDKHLLNDVTTYLESHSVSVETITLENSIRFGEPVPAELERVAIQGDGAIVLASPDDLGRLIGGEDAPRARQNVWLELGWFWARLGRRRTLLVVKSEIEIPSDLAGLMHLKLRHSVDEITADLDKFIKGLNTDQGEALTEIISVSADYEKRNQAYQEIYDSAHLLVVTTGIGMVNVRQDLPNRVRKTHNPSYGPKLEYIILDKEFCIDFPDLLKRVYRPNLIQDIETFERDLANYMRDPAVPKDAVTLYRYAGLMTFSATVADPGDWGSLMLVDTLLPFSNDNFVRRPRILLRRRCVDGVYDRYWKAIKDMREQATA